MAAGRQYVIGFKPDAIVDLDWYRKFDQQTIRGAIRARLAHQPTVESRHLRHLRPNPLAEWELRVGDFRVFYNVDEENARVTVLAVGYKPGNQVFIRGQEYHL